MNGVFVAVEEKIQLPQALILLVSHVSNYGDMDALIQLSLANEAEAKVVGFPNPFKFDGGGKMTATMPASCCLPLSSILFSKCTWTKYTLYRKPISHALGRINIL